MLFEQVLQNNNTFGVKTIQCHLLLLTELLITKYGDTQQTGAVL